MQKIIFKPIKPQHPELPLLIKPSIGNPTFAKIQEVLVYYKAEYHFLIGSFLEENLVGVIGIEIKDSKAIIKHLSVLEKYRTQGIGKGMVNYIINQFPIKSIFAETDDEAKEFYKKLGFNYSQFQGKYGKRYKCSLDLES